MTENRDLIQGSPEWHEARRGKITGSRFKDVLSTRGSTRANYIQELLLERKTGLVAESFCNGDMEWGIQTEPQAREYYERTRDVKVTQVGFIDHPLEQYRGYVGVSPDGEVDIDGIIEIKCPNTKTHLEYVAKKVLPSKYIPQVQGVLWVTGRDWCDFISFDPRVEAEPFFCVRVDRDQAYINKLAAACDVFIQEMVELQKNQVEVDPQLLRDVTGGCSPEDWQLKLQDEIRGKVRHGVTCAYIKSGKMIDRDGIPLSPKAQPYIVKNINEWVDFIMTGK